jgi:hypothetical protein
MKQAKKMQEKIASIQAELESKTVEATAGGGMVTVVVNGKCFRTLSWRQLMKAFAKPRKWQRQRCLRLPAASISPV